MKDILSQNLQQLRGQIAEACDKYDRDADDISVVAVTKTQPAAVVKTAIAAGLHNIGESRIQDAQPKIVEIGRIATFHMVGHLQTNKVKKAVELFDVIQSVDSLRLAVAISDEARAIGRTIDCLVQVNISGESQKNGVAPGDCLELLKQVRELPFLSLSGLMTIGPLSDDDNKVREAFKRCRDLYGRCSVTAGPSFDTLSMGMSGDFRLAIAEGSTMVRIGRSLFGKSSI